MKKFPLWAYSIPVILLAALFQITFDLGEQGHLGSVFLREKIYPIAQTINGTMTNIKFRFRGPKEPMNKIVIVEADEDSVATLGRWPWHREVYAQLIHAIFEMGARNVGLDVAFSEPEERIPNEVYEKLKQDPKLLEFLKGFEGDAVLARVFNKYHQKVALGYSYEVSCQPKYSPINECPVQDPEIQQDIEQRIGKFAMKSEAPFVAGQFQNSPFRFMISLFSNIPVLRDSAEHAGIFGADPDHDGYIRKYSLFNVGAGKLYPSLGLKMAELAKDDHFQVDFNQEGLVKRAYFSKTPDISVPVTPLGFINLNFRGPSRSFKYISVLDVFKAYDGNNPEVKEALKEANVFFGATAIGIYDMRAFPFDSNTAGVEGHATATDNLMSNDMLRSASSIGLPWVPLTAIFLFGMLSAVLYSSMGAIASIASFAVLMVGLGFVDLKILFAQNINFPTAFLVLELLVIFALTLSIRFILEERNKKAVRDAFSHYLAPQVVDLVLKDPDKLVVGGERKELTVLFSDLRGFTTFSENMDPKVLTQFLNEYLSAITDIIFEYEGTLDKYIGDAVMAFWGAPIHQENHVERAWQAALAMKKRLSEIAPDFKSRYGIEVSAGIGVNSGVVSVGNMGSKRIFEYTVIGDHVNLASRLESLTRLYGSDILSTRESFNLMQASSKSKFQCRTLDSVKVKGKKNAVEIVSVMEHPSPAGLEETFELAKSQFKMRNWGEAKKLFEEASSIQQRADGKPDVPSQIYLERCDLFKANPPGADWDGSIEMRSK